MTDKIRFTLAQYNPTVGNVAKNAARAKDAWDAGKAAGADLVMLPEMFLAGYQAQDLTIRPAFVAHCEAALAALAKDCADGPALGVGAPWLRDGLCYNTYRILQGGKEVANVLKQELPNVQVFDERRLFASAEPQGPVSINGVRVGIPICEDAWHPDVSETLAESGAEILLVPNGSPYYRGKFERRMNTMVARVVETGLPMVYLNFVGGQDDQVFDGGSFVINADHHLAVQMPLFDEALETVLHGQDRLQKGAFGAVWRD